MIALEDTGVNSEEIILLYAHKDKEIDQSYLNKELSGKTTLKIKLISLNDLLGEKKEALYTPDNAGIIVTKEGHKYKVEIQQFFSPYLKKKIDDYNAKRDLLNNAQHIKLSDNGLELIEAVQFDTTLKSGIWISNIALEDKAKIKEKIKGIYYLDTDKFKIKVRNIAGDEIIIDAKELL